MFNRTLMRSAPFKRNIPRGDVGLAILSSRGVDANIPSYLRFHNTNRQNIFTPGRYVGIADVEEDGIPFEEKMEMLSGQLWQLMAQSHQLDEKTKQNLGRLGYGSDAGKNKRPLHSKGTSD